MKKPIYLRCIRTRPIAAQLSLASSYHPLKAQGYEYEHGGTDANALHAFMLTTNHKMLDARSIVLWVGDTVVGGPDFLAPYPPIEFDRFRLG